MVRTDTPPPGQVFEHAEGAVDLVRQALGLTLDYTPETLPVLDHYLGEVPRDKRETIKLVAAGAGAYFGEVVRRTIGGDWLLETDAPKSWRVVLPGDVSFAPVGFVMEILLHDQDEELATDGDFEVPKPDRAAVEEALLSMAGVPEEEYYSLSGRLETLLLVLDLVNSRKATRS